MRLSTMENLVPPGIREGLSLSSVRSPGCRCNGDTQPEGAGQNDGRRQPWMLTLNCSSARFAQNLASTTFWQTGGVKRYVRTPAPVQHNVRRGPGVRLSAVPQPPMVSVGP